MYTHSTSRSASQLNPDAYADALKAEIAQLEITLGDEDPEKILARHIKLLHEYNEAKDATQALIGRLAVIKETTVTQLHSDYGLPTQD